MSTKDAIEKKFGCTIEEFVARENAINERLAGCETERSKSIFRGITPEEFEYFEDYINAHGLKLVFA